MPLFISLSPYYFSSLLLNHRKVNKFVNIFQIKNTFFINNYIYKSSISSEAMNISRPCHVERSRDISAALQ